MPAVGKIFGNHLNVVKSSGNIHSRLQEEEDFFSMYGDQYRAVIENSNGVPYQLIYDPESGNGYFRFMGEGISRILGVDSTGMTERHFFDMIEEFRPVSENMPADPAEAVKLMKNGAMSSCKAEMLVRCAGGEKKWLCDSSLPIRDESGEVTGICGILFDISERKQMMALLDIISKKADECDRLKNSFLRNISHEVRTPLNAIVGFSTLLCEPDQAYEQKIQFLDILNSSTDHFLGIMDNILESSRIEAGTMPVNLEEVDITDLLERVYDRFRSPAEKKNISLYFHTPCTPGKHSVKTDGYKLFQVLSNLLSNAVKFTISGRIDFGYAMHEDHLEFFVHDTGIGIKDEHRNNVFNKFFQAESGTTRRFPGTGLGLSISKAYIEMLGGSISFSSEHGGGSRFRFNIPLRDN